VELLDGVDQLGGLDALDVHELGLHRPLDLSRESIDQPHPGLSRRQMLSHSGPSCPGRPPPANGDRLARTQEARDPWITKHRRRGEEVDLPLERCRNDQGIDQVVRTLAIASSEWVDDDAGRSRPSLSVPLK
jgi:hypothetical protein